MSGYTVQFSEGTNIWNLYEALKKEGIKDSKLDTGYYEADYVNKEHTIVHKNDKIIQEEEVLNYVLERYDKYRALIKEKLDYEIPWLLDDFDPATTFDFKIRDSLDAAITVFRKELKEAGYKPKQSKYKELMAVSIYGFVMASKSFHVAQVEEELKNQNLQEINDYINETGGLGLIEIMEDCEVEATALQSLNLECGWCSERSAVLFSALKIAGLNVSFIHGLPSSKLLKKMWQSTVDTHEAVALILPGKMRILDPTFKMSDGKDYYDENFLWWYPRSLRESLSAYYANLGANYQGKGEFDKAIEELKKAVEIDPSSLAAHLNLGNAYTSKGDFDKAVEELKKATEINPDNALTHNNLAYAYALKGEFDKAIEGYTKVLEINPKYLQVRHSLANAYRDNGDFDKAIEEYNKIMDKYPYFPDVRNNLGLTYYGKGEFDKAIEEYKIALMIAPSYSDAHYNLANALYASGRQLINEGKTEKGWEKLKEADSELFKVLIVSPFDTKSLELFETIESFQEEVQAEHPGLKLTGDSHE